MLLPSGQEDFSCMKDMVEKLSPGVDLVMDSFSSTLSAAMVVMQLLQN